MGVKYVKNFEFPSGFGFSGSATDGTTTTVRSHERTKPQRFAKGGRVKKHSLKPTPGQVVGGALAAGAGLAALSKMNKEGKADEERLSVPETARGGIRARRERELGLKAGGKVRRSMKNC